MLRRRRAVPVRRIGDVWVVCGRKEDRGSRVEEDGEEEDEGGVVR